jgi:hypothetical protein
VDADIVGSPEYYLLHSGAGDSSFVIAAYQNLLGRTPAAEEVRVASDFLVSNGLRGLFAWLLLSSPEVATERVQSYYDTYLDRNADPGGLAGFVGALEHGVRDELAPALILGFDEYFAGF